MHMKHLPAVSVFLLVYLACSTRSEHRSVSSDYNSNGVAIDFFTHHLKVLEGKDLRLRCKVVIADEREVEVEWLFVGTSKSQKTAEIVAVGEDVKLRNREGVSVRIRRSYDTIEDINVEEHFLHIKHTQLSDKGTYACQVSNFDPLCNSRVPEPHNE
jgi:hypothetical protein